MLALLKFPAIDLVNWDKNALKTIRFIRPCCLCYLLEIFDYLSIGVLFKRHLATAVYYRNYLTN